MAPSKAAHLMRCLQLLWVMLSNLSTWFASTNIILGASVNGSKIHAELLPPCYEVNLLNIKIILLNLWDINDLAFKSWPLLSCFNLFLISCYVNDDWRCVKGRGFEDWSDKLTNHGPWKILEWINEEYIWEKHKVGGQKWWTFISLKKLKVKSWTHWPSLPVNNEVGRIIFRRVI